MLEALHAISDFNGLALDRNRKSKAFDSDKVTAHTAIIPTANVPALNALSEHERWVYLAIAQHYLVQFMPNKRYQEASVVVEVDAETFSARATKTMDAGFSAFLKGEASDANDEDMPDSAFEVLQTLRTGETGRCDAVTVNEKKTTTPHCSPKQHYWQHWCG